MNLERMTQGGVEKYLHKAVVALLIFEAEKSHITFVWGHPGEGDSYKSFTHSISAREEVNVRDTEQHVITTYLDRILLPYLRSEFLLDLDAQERLLAERMFSDALKAYQERVKGKVVGPPKGILLEKNTHRLQACKMIKRAPPAQK